MNIFDAINTGKPYRLRGYKTSAWFNLTYDTAWQYFSTVECCSEMWEIDPGPETVTLTKAQVYEAVEKAYKDLLKCRRAGHMRLSHAVYPDVRKILKHMGFGEKS